VQDAIKAASGVRADANLNAINLAAPVKDGDRLDIATLAPTTPPQAIREYQGSARSIALPTPEPLPAESGKVNINTAGLDELDTLPGIGPVTAQKIIDYRQTYGPFKTIEAIIDVSGIGPATYARLKDLITVGNQP
jgi:competence protein ComEA